MSEDPGLSPSPLSTEGALVNHTVAILRFGVLVLGGPVMAVLGKKRVAGELKDLRKVGWVLSYFLGAPMTLLSPTGTLMVLIHPYPRKVEEPSIYESVRVHTAMQTGRTENDLVPSAPSVSATGLRQLRASGTWVQAGSEHFSQST